jgi:hypothetical protein
MTRFGCEFPPPKSVSNFSRDKSFNRDVRAFTGWLWKDRAEYWKKKKRERRHDLSGVEVVPATYCYTRSRRTHFDRGST